MSALRSAACVVVVAAVVATSACSRAAEPPRLRFAQGERSVFDIVDDEDAPDVMIGLAGKLSCRTRLSISVHGVDAQGVAEAEALVPLVQIDAPPPTGMDVDTEARAPLAGDKVGATAVVRSLLPGASAISITPLGETRFVRNAETAAHVAAWGKGKSMTSAVAVQRIAERVDAGIVAERLLSVVSALLPRDAVAPGAPWTVEPPHVESPAGPLAPKLTVTMRNDGKDVILEARGTVSPAEPPSKRHTADFLRGDIAWDVQIDATTGALVAVREKTTVVFRRRDGERLEAPWTHTRTARRVETK